MMQTIFWIVFLVGGAFFLAYRGTKLKTWTVAAAGALAIMQLSGAGFSLLPWMVFGAVAAVLNAKPIRRRIISSYVFRWFRSVLPPMSETEQAAIDAGTTWWDGELFSGRPDWNELLDFPAPELTKEEQDFLDGPVEDLCRMLDDWHISEELNDLPEDVWQYLKEKRFFGMIIPREYGGLEFSPYAQSEVVMKIATRSVSAAVTVMVPNSLGPGELLLQYGTEDQRQHYLPRLAQGLDIPAFALTNPHAGSDAGAMPDTGVVCMGMYEGKETLGFRVNWEKRYITLGPVCTVLGLAFKAIDPDGLLGDREDLGITCALVPTDTHGVTIGARHAPGAAFQNGPNSGSDVFVPMDWIIGGQSQVGNGWKMLMNCLAVGRAISLPALGAAAGKLASLTSGAYARVREQFNIPIGKFEGIEEALARIGGVTYRMDAARLLTTVALQQGEKPSVLSAILKYHNTEGMRHVINNAMDIHGGRSICRGPRNYLQSMYRALPVAITVEGANILTRSMIIFGQGAIRCHPYVLEEMRATANPDASAGLEKFDETLFRHMGFTIRNAARAFVLGLTGARIANAPYDLDLRGYYRQLSRMSAAFAFVADTTMLTLGGQLKRKERLSARLGDVLSHMYLASAVLKHHYDNGSPSVDLPLVTWAVEDSLRTMQESLICILENFPSPLFGRAVKLLIFPLGRAYRTASDKLDHEVAQVLMEPSGTRDRLTAGCFVNRAEDDPVGLLEIALASAEDVAPIKAAAARSARRPLVGAGGDAEIAATIESGAINEFDGAKLREYLRVVGNVIRVDEFPPEARASSSNRVIR
jgi:acyl-CoA dehydrogenase